MDSRILISLLFLTLFHKTAATEKLKVCIAESERTAKAIRVFCDDFELLSSPIECVIGNDRFNCLRRLTTRNADFTVLEPEDLVAAPAYAEYNILVTNELRLFEREKQHFEMVAIVHKDVKNMWDIEGRRFCHPGFEPADDWTKAFSMYFEEMIIPKECDPTKTLLENRVAALSNFFESACIAGPWSPDSTFDNQLKTKYRNLCASCDDPAGCYASDKYHGREGALLCLTDNAGDIAWVRLGDALEHFKDEHINKEDYNYLCPDSTTRPVALGKPCVWITKPWPVIVARSEVAENVTIMMHYLRWVMPQWGSKLEKLLENYHPSPVSTEALETPDDFLRRFPGFVSANNRAACHPSRRVQWCVASNLESRKCRWLREASFVYGIEPAISCIQVSSRSSCMDAVRNGRADIFVAKPEELLEARKKGLRAIVHGMPKRKEDLNRIAAVVKQNSRFRSLKDLKGARACFPGYKSVEWNAVTAIIKNISDASSDCLDANIIGNFFKDSCVLGLNENGNEVPYNLYSLCKQAGRAGDDISTFDCLSSGLGDVAFVNLKSIEKKTGSLSQRRESNNSEYRTLCLEEIESERDSACLLTWTSLSTVVGHENMTNLRREEIYSMLLEMDQFFGRTFKGRTPIFSMYGIYDSNHSVIFPEEVHHLQFDDHRMNRGRSYDDIVQHLIKQAPCSSDRIWCWSVGNMIVLSVLLFILDKALLF